MRRQDLRVEMAVWVWTHMINEQAAYHRSLTRWNTSYYDHCRRVEEAPPAYQLYILYLILSIFKPQTTESAGYSLHCSHWRQSRTPGSLTLVSVTTKHKSLHWARNRHLPMVGLPTVTGQAVEKRTWRISFICQGLLLGHSGMNWVSSRTLFVPSGKRQEQHLVSILVLILYCGNYISITGTPALRSLIHVDVGEPTRYPCSMTGMMQDHHFLQLWVTWDIYLGNCYVIVKKYWAAWGFLFWKRSVSPSSLGVFLRCFGFVVCWVCFVLISEDTWLFAFTYSPICGNS